jgi:hypothetical protein
VCIEDKAPPAVDCSPDTILCFELANLPTEIIAHDNCSGPTKVIIVSEQYIDYGCDSALIQGVIKRRLIASDIWGNYNYCEKIYYIRKINLSEVVCPRDTSVDCSIAKIRINNRLVDISDPIRSGAPKVGNVSLWPNNPSCKLTLDYHDEILQTCGNSYKIVRTWVISDWCSHKDTVCKQLIKVEDKTVPYAIDKVLPTVPADPHDCQAKIHIDTLVVSDCNRVTQTYRYTYIDPETGISRIANGTLPADLWFGNGKTEITVTLTDACNNRVDRKITVNVVDQTPPTPVCHEFTQVTVDPASCWAFITAKDLDNGSHDNCVKELHFAAALMSEIEKARKDYADSIIKSCGSKEYWDNKVWYDRYIEEWINCYVFRDVIELGDCGTNLVVMRVYEADSIPKLDPHIFTCGEHAWFCYNSYTAYRTVHNYNFFAPGIIPGKDCNVKGPMVMPGSQRQLV